MRLTIKKDKWNYSLPNGEKVEFRDCNIGIHKGKTFMIQGDIATEVTITKSHEQPKAFGGTYQVVEEVETFGVYTTKEVFYTQARKTSFQIESGKKYEGYTFNNEWNGWSMPMFEKDVADSILSDFFDDKTLAYYDNTSDSYIIKAKDTNEEDEYKGFDVTCDQNTIHVYEIGAGAWIWSEA